MTRSTATARARAPRDEPLHGGPPPPSAGPAISNGRIAVAMLIAAETMLFTGLMGAYVVLRGSADSWPPPGQPRLPLAVTWVNTAVLAGSCVTMAGGWRALRARDGRRLRRAVASTAVLGGAFLAVQGTEWVRLLRHGLTVSSSMYGATFYTLVGLHGAHVLAAVAWMTGVALRLRAGPFAPSRAAGADLCAVYWFFVCGLWGVLFPLVYLR